MELPVKIKDSNEEYHNSGFISKSKLSYMGKSPYHFKYYVENPPPKTAALEFGTALHSFILEPDLFAEEYFVLPENFDMRKKDCKEIYANIVARGQKAISNSDYLTLCDMKKSLYENKYTKALLQGEKEVSYYWQDETTGIKLSCRPDSRRVLKSGNEGIIVDLKTCKSAETEKFMRDSIGFNYDLQAYMYKTGVELIEQIPHRFVFICIEKEAPYAVNILECDDYYIEHGRDKFRQYLGMLKECMETDNWYSYNGATQEINALGLPAYILKELI